ncbi:restriction endonuclease subunit S [Acinetobacter variabilis]|uniref:restriction endonuclease subunit S n=1 Tax=Acinetobacter variabilis TaxID=70346 RepID=UPI0028A1EF80|nr:restriction endonuclease subunit S [Acinetobacter variabilis]
MKIAQATIKIVHADECMDVRDGTHDSPKFIEKGIPLVTSKNLVNGKIDFSTCSFISEEDHEAISKRSRVDDGDILYAMIGTIGNPVIVNKDSDFSIKNVALFKFNNPDVYNRYIYHFLNSDLAKKQLAKLSRGGTQKFISLGNLRKLKIPLPPLEEQRRIASILDKADDLRQKRQQAIEKLDQLLQATFIDMFGDFQINPMNWQTKPLSEVVNNTTIVTYGIVQAGEEYPDGIPYIRTGDIKNGSILTENLSRTDPEIAKKFKRSEVQTGDIVMSIRATVGTTALVPKILNGANLTQGTARIAVGENIEREYALYHLRCQATQNWIQKQVKGATFREITLGKLRELPVYLPPRDLQKKFVEIYNSIEMLKLNANKSLESSKQLFKSLQNQAFSGNL